MSRFLFFVITLIELCCALNSNASINANSIEYTEQCGSVENVKGAEYCISLPKNFLASEVLYYFHGLGGGVHSWKPDGASIVEEWSKRNLPPPVIITISFGDVWFLTDTPPDDRDIRTDSVIEKAIPSIERKLDFPVNKRWLLAFSMGGYNAIQVFHRRPDLFSKVALGCPAIPTVSPHASYFDILQFVVRTGANWFAAYKGLEIARRFFPTEAIWQKGNPLRFDERGRFPFPEIYISAVTKDAYGFQEGDHEYAKNLKEQGQKINWTYFEGLHCWSRANEITDFLYQ